MAEKTVKALPLVPAEYDSVNESINRRTIEQALQDLYSEVGHVKDMQESGISKAVKRHIFLLMGASHCCFNGGSISMMLTALSGIKLPDNEKLFFGDGNDLQIYHDGNHSRIVESGSGDIIIQGDEFSLMNVAGDEYMIFADNNSFVKLYYDGSKKFETTNTGAKFTGDAVATDEFRGEVVNYAANQDAPYLIAGTSGYTGATTNWNTYGFQHRIKTDSGGAPRVTIDTSSAEVFNVTNNNRIGIGTSSPQSKLTLENGLQRINATDGSSDARIQFVMTDGSNSPSAWIGIPNWNKDGLYIFGPTANGNEVAALYTQARWQFNTGGSERARILSGGAFLIGKTALGVNTQGLQFNGGLLAVTKDGGEPLILNRKTTDGVVADFRKDNTSVGRTVSFAGDLIIQTGITGLRFNDANDAIHPVIVNGTVSDGATDLGLTNARFKDLYLSGKAQADTYQFAQNSSAVGATDAIYRATTATLAFKTGSSERMRLNTTGLLVSGTTVGEENSFAAGSSGNVTISRQSGDPRTMISFLNGGSTVGKITTSTTATTYNTSSDARLKDVTGKAKGLEIINKLNPVSYNWKFNNKADEGLIAQEVKDVVPNAVTGSEEDYYMMDYSKLVTPLVKAVQEQQEQIETLKSEIAKLKGE